MIHVNSTGLTRNNLVHPKRHPTSAGAIAEMQVYLLRIGRCGIFNNSRIIALTRLTLKEEYKSLPMNFFGLRRLFSGPLSKLMILVRLPYARGCRRSYPSKRQVSLNYHRS